MTGMLLLALIGCSHKQEEVKIETEDVIFCAPLILFTVSWSHGYDHSLYE